MLQLMISVVCNNLQLPIVALRKNSSGSSMNSLFHIEFLTLQLICLSKLAQSYEKIGATKNANQRKDTLYICGNWLKHVKKPWIFYVSLSSSFLRGAVYWTRRVENVWTQGLHPQFNLDFPDILRCNPILRISSQVAIHWDSFSSKTKNLSPGRFFSGSPWP